MDAPSRVGGRRGIIVSQTCLASAQVVSWDDPFPTSPLRTKRDRFRITSLSSGHSCRLETTSDIQRHSGSPHFAYRMTPERRPPVSLRPIDGSPILPGET